MAETWNARTSIRTLKHTPTSGIKNDASVVETTPTDLCYACHTALTSRGAKSVMPRDGGATPMPMWALKQEIGEFLLSEDEDGEALDPDPDRLVIS